MGRPGTGLLLLFVLISFLIVTGFFIFFKREASPLNGENEEGEENTENIGKKGIARDGGKYNVEEFAVDDHEPAQQVVTDQRKKPVEREGKVSGEVELVPVVSKPVKHQKPVDHNKVDFTIENLDKEIEITGKPSEKPVNKMVESQQEKPAFKVTEKVVQKSPINERQGLDTDYDPRLDLPHYKFPTLDLLNNYGSDTINVRKEELEENKNRIVETLNHYQIQIQKIKATIGPTVTLYEIVPAPGVRISKIKNLEDDIALSLSAFGIRIIAPIPGKGTVGIEVPNQNPDIVSMRSVLASEKFQNTKYDLPFGMGKTISNEVYIADLTKMPHILMAGATGQGKSVGLNAIIASFLYKKHPSELKFVMVDPKKVELTLFSKIERHYLAKLPDAEEAIITDTRKVVRTLNSLGIEMDTRYELLKDAQVRNIKEYNTKFLSRKLNPNEGHHFLPYIVVVIDEFADLIMTAGKEIEIPLTRLAQLARAVGIHLVIATQRPSVNIITGSIKANFPARLAFRVISKIDSRTILDSPGADQLIGRGDMLLSTGSELIRLQCAFIDTPEIDKVTEFIGSQRGYPDAYHLPEFADEQAEPILEFDPSERDPLFEDSARILVANQQGSTSLLQRKLKIGYNRAGRIIDQLEAAGIVGPFEGSKAREVLIKSELELEEFLRDFDKNR
jgi:S-DNA-T family DNA segregation ATPase FtsK/SpoIIIE